MTPQEFKAWFDGFTEAFDRLPTKAQWARVKERVAEIDGKAVTERVYVDRYWPVARPYYQTLSPYYWNYLTTTGVCQSAGNIDISNQLQANTANNTGYQSLGAMNALGRAEAQSLSN